MEEHGDLVGHSKWGRRELEGLGVCAHRKGQQGSCGRGGSRGLGRHGHREVVHHTQGHLGASSSLSVRVTLSGFWAQKLNGAKAEAQAT